MAVKRLNYFTSQFLVEKDFKDEQDYHVSMRRRLNKSLHTWGVASGLTVTKASNRSVNIAPGIAIDNTGHEIVLTDSTPYPLSVSTPNTDVYLFIAYHETFDSADRYISGAINNYIRTSEVPVVTDTAALPASDGSVVTLARIHLDSSGNIANDSDVNITVVKKVGSSVAPGAISTTEIANGSVTLDKLADTVKPLVSIDGVSNPGGNVDLVQNNAITITSDNLNKRITIGESHSGNMSNPHSTTAAQVGALSIAGGTLSGGLQVNSNIGVTGTVDGRDVSVDGANLDAHRTNVSNPHSTTAAQVGALPLAGGTLSGALQVNSNIGVTGTVDGRDVSVDGTNLDAHRSNFSNPHVTTAAQIDNQSGQNSIVNQINAGTGIIAARNIERGWVCLPFLPEKYSSTAEFNHMVVHSTSSAAAYGNIGFPVPPGASVVKGFRIAGASNSGTITLNLYRWSLNVQNNTWDNQMILYANINPATPLNEFYAINSPLNGADAIGLYVYASAASDITLVAVQFQ